MKCQKNPQAPQLVACPFNYLHRVRPEDRRDHAIICEDRVYTKYADREPPSYATTRKQFFGVEKEQVKHTKRDTEVDDNEEFW